MTLKNFSYTRKNVQTITQDTKKSLFMLHYSKTTPPKKKPLKKILKSAISQKAPYRTSVIREQNEKSSHNWGGGGGYSS